MDVIGNFAATLLRSIFLKPCRGRRPRRPGKQQILLFKRLPTIAGCKLKILSFPGRRGRRPLQAKIQTASTHRYGAETLSFPGRRGRRPLQEIANIFAPLRVTRSRLCMIASSLRGNFFTKGSPWGELPPQVGERGIVGRRLGAAVTNGFH